MDIGDVSLPLPAPAIEAMHFALDEMGDSATFHGYGPEQGYPFLREAIAKGDYHDRGLSHIHPDDIFVSDGAKSDVGNMSDLFGPGVRVAVCDPAYPVYVDSNVIDGRAGVPVDGRWSKLTYLPCTPDNGFKPALPEGDVDVIYLCSPNNPTGTAMTRDDLRKWIDYALSHGALIIYDSAYEAYVTEPDVPRSIYEVEGAERCAIEVRSFSKTAGFTGMRCGYTVVPEALKYKFSDGSEASLRKMWRRRQCTKFNGAGYIQQRGAAALYSEAGRESVKANVDVYVANARLLRDTLVGCGCQVFGGVNSPYVWFRAPGDLTSWQLFEKILREAHLTSTPGSGFGVTGEGFIRFTGFNTAENTREAARRLQKILV